MKNGKKSENKIIELEKKIKALRAIIRKLCREMKDLESLADAHIAHDGRVDLYNEY